MNENTYKRNPFYLNNEVKDDLEINLGMLPANLKEKYGQIEDLVSKQFVEIL